MSALAGRRIVLGVSGGSELLGVDALVGDLVGGDLGERDRQRLAGAGLDLRRDGCAEALAEVAEVAVDRASTPGREGDERELGIDAAEQLLDRRIHHRVVLAHAGAPLVLAWLPEGARR
jgi:hypothetical protein